LLGSKVLDADAHKHWESLFLENLRYDLFWSEVATLAAMLFTFLLMPAVGVAAYFSSPIRRLLHLPPSPGETAHRMFAVILAVGPFALMAAGLVFWITLLIGSSDSSREKSILTIYSVSALRLFNLLPVLLPFVRVILDVAGDIIFYLQPRTSKLSSLPQTLPRLKKMLASIRHERPANFILVLAHSQGSVIAWTALCEQPGDADELLTMGSPLTTLYHCFLGKAYGTTAPGSGIQWENIFREGDYIGGEVAGCANNQPIGAGEHTDYWKDARLIKEL
jgi:hypothetical protein